MEARKLCGIFGFNYEDKSLIKKMCETIIHLGPDDFGYIIDLKSGNQPQHNENEDKWIVYNGEIYNFNVLRIDLEQRCHNFYTKSDTDVNIHAYEECGSHF